MLGAIHATHVPQSVVCDLAIESPVFVLCTVTRQKSAAEPAFFATSRHTPVAIGKSCHDILARPPYFIWLAKISYLIRPR